MVFEVICEAMSFNHFGLLPQVVRGTQAMGFVKPTPIQRRVFLIVLARKDLSGTAQTELANFSRAPTDLPITSEY